MWKVIRKEGRTVPMVCCDACGVWIEDARLGAAVFASLNAEEDIKEVAIVHKGACHDRIESAILAKGQSMGWMELSRYLVDALHNSKLTFEEIKIMEAGNKEFGRL
jgi:hypothetical protein